MRHVILSALGVLTAGCGQKAGEVKSDTASKTAQVTGESKRLYLDVHDVPNVTAKDVAEAHKKDLATETRHGVEFKAYWVDEKQGKVYCLAEAASADAMRTVHREAHGLLPRAVMQVTADTKSWAPSPGRKLFLDFHHLGAGKVTPEAVAEAHKKDLAVQGKHDVKYLNYWLDQDSGTVVCLSEAPTAEAAVTVHTEAHGLVPDSIAEVSEGR
jgi:hypothetical protein